jgi:hypothetical protein
MHLQMLQHNDPAFHTSSTVSAAAIKGTPGYNSVLGFFTN